MNTIIIIAIIYFSIGLLLASLLLGIATKIAEKQDITVNKKKQAYIFVINAVFWPFVFVWVIGLRIAE